MFFSINRIMFFATAIFSSASFSVINQNNQTITFDQQAPFVEGQVLVRIKESANNLLVEKFSQSIGAKTLALFSLVPGLRLYQFDPRQDVMEVIKSLESNDAVLYAEPNFLYGTAEKKKNVNDPEFSKLWALENTGQNEGKIDADINALLTWQHETGSRKVAIGIIDTGIDYNHPDLEDNIWTNELEIKNNGIDDDNNGFIDDIHGINVIKGSGDPMDDNLHGTHVAGTIGAVGNNHVGVVGVAPKVELIACKFLSDRGTGSTSDAVKCMEYIATLKSRTTNPLNIVATNNSWGGGGSSQAMIDAINAHEKLGILFIAAAGNKGVDNDVTDSFPANYNVANVISVAATDNNDRLAYFSNYGRKKVHVAAPGAKIVSTIPEGKYGELSGTSMATPHVSGIAALLAAHYDEINYIAIKNLIMTGAQKTQGTESTTISGRRLRGADVDGVGSLTCRDQYLVIRTEPQEKNLRILLGNEIFLAAYHLNCAEYAGPFAIYQKEKDRIILDDNGKNGDELANDGIYSLKWKPTATGEYELKFSETDSITVTVYDNDHVSPYVANSVPYEYAFVDGVRLFAGDDTMHSIKAPFPILFGGHYQKFSDLYVSSNGTISFTDDNDPGYVNLPLPTSLVETIIAPFWDDLAISDQNCDIYIDVLGNAPARQFVVEWWQYKHFYSPGALSFQVIFYEDSPNFRFNYMAADFINLAYDNGKSATIGVQIDRKNALQYSYNQPLIASRSSLLFSLQ